MLLINDLKNKRMKALKERDKITKSILDTLLGLLETDSKRTQSEITDEMVMAHCKKLIESNTLTNKVRHSDNLVRENEILNTFLPQQLNEEQLRTIISDLGASNIGEVMKHLKTNYTGQYDGGLASKIAKTTI